MDLNTAGKKIEIYAYALRVSAIDTDGSQSSPNPEQLVALH
jgi:hypothetical protein